MLRMHRGRRGDARHAVPGSRPCSQTAVRIYRLSTAQKLAHTVPTLPETSPSPPHAASAPARCRPSPVCSSPRPARTQPAGTAAAPPRTSPSPPRAASAEALVSQSPDAVRLAQYVPHAPVQRQRLLVSSPRLLMLRALQSDVAQAPDAVRLAQHGPHPPVQRQRLLVLFPRLLVMRAPKRDVAQALVQFASPRTSPTRRYSGSASSYLPLASSCCERSSAMLPKLLMQFASPRTSPTRRYSGSASSYLPLRPHAASAEARGRPGSGCSSPRGALLRAGGLLEPAPALRKPAPPDPRT